MLKTSSYKDLGQGNIINMYLEENAIDSLFGKSLSKAPGKSWGQYQRGKGNSNLSFVQCHLIPIPNHLISSPVK